MNTQTHGEKLHRSLWKSPALITASFVVMILLANRLVDGWNWELRGIVLFGAIIFGLSLTYQLVTRNVE